MTARLNWLWVVGVMILISMCCQAQQNATGRQAFGSFSGGPDIINLGNLDVSLDIPILNRQGRGIPFVFDLTYDSSLVWLPVTTGSTTSWTPQPGWGWPASVSAVGYIPSPTEFSFTIICKAYPVQTYQTITDRVYPGYVDLRGTLHHAPGLSTETITGDSSCAGGSNGSAKTDDGSGYTISISYGQTVNSATVTSKSGSTFTAPIGRGVTTLALDSNGNEITVDPATGKFYDTLSSTSPVLTVTGISPSPVNYTYSAPSGAVSVVVSYKSYPVQTHFQCSGVTDYGASSPINNYLVDKITYHDGSFYQFTYEPTVLHSPNVTGRIASITFPTGGTISYAYTGSNGGINCADGTTMGFERTTPDSSTPWQYSRSGTNPNWTTTVTDPVGTVTTYNLYQVTSTTTRGSASQDTNTYYERNHTGSGKTVLTCHNAVYSGCTTAALTLPFSQIDQYVTLGSKTSATESKFDTANGGRVTEVRQYDFGVTLGVAPPAPPSSLLLKDTTISYASLTGILDHPYQVTVKDGSGNTKAQTTFTYSDTVTGTTGTPQHTSPSGSRGNAITITSLTSGSSTLDKHFTYFDTGNVITATDVNTAVTTYVYGSATTTCGNAFPTEVDLPLSLTQQSTWNCTGAVMASSTDVNGNQTTYKYVDPNFWRLTEVDTPSGGKTAYTYNTSSPPWDVATSSKQTSTTYLTTDTVLDGLGRTSQTQLTSDPAGTDYVDTGYDALGRLYSVSNPHRSTSSPTDGTTYYTYDGLSRPYQVTFPDGNKTTTEYTNNTIDWFAEGNATAGFFQVDGLGRLTAVCERIVYPPGTQANGDTPIPTGCNPDYPSYPAFKTTYGHDVFGNITSVTQNAQNPPYASQTRSFTYDGLSRLTQEINPETGEKDYAYDTLHGGDLYTLKAGEPNHTGWVASTTTYTFDLLHRITNITYGDPYTPTKYFYWDTQSWWSGVTPNYPKGRLARQNSSACGTTCAGEEYNYDMDGNIVGKATWTPSNIGSAVASYYSYNYLDQQTSMTDIWGNVYTTSYDAAGRATSLTSSLSDSTHPPTLYTVNAYNPLGEITSGTYAHTGSGTTATAHTATFDNRGRLLTIYDAVTGGFPYSLTLTYLNGRVASANDSVNGNWSSFNYDDFNRLRSSWCSANCPDGTNAEGYNYTYDEYGNRWTQALASGSGPGLTPSYSFDINNRLTPTNCTNGADNFCYDGAGNLEYDGQGGNWAHDAEGRVFAYDTSSASDTYTSDAAGQRLERTVNGLTYDYVFDNQGHENTKGAVGFASWHWSELYLGGMHVNTYTNGSTYFSHADHLGSERMETDPTGNTNASTNTNLPFGEWTSSGMESELGFTGDLLDNPDGNVFHTPFRQLSQTQGRWMTPDPAGLAAVDITNPQTWNRYAYVANNPTSFVDLSGLVDINAAMQFFARGGGGGGWQCVSAGGMGTTFTSDGVDAVCSVINNIINGGASTLTDNGTGLPSFFTPGGGMCQLHSIPGEQFNSYYDCTGNFFSPSDPRSQLIAAQPQPRKKCYGSNSITDKAVQFFSLLRLPETWEEWVGGGVAKISFVWVAQAGAKSAGGAESLGSAAIGAGATFIGYAGSAAIIGATMADLNCQIGPVEPYTGK
jgi:RHS repeat-associated protein